MKTDKKAIFAALSLAFWTIALALPEATFGQVVTSFGEDQGFQVQLVSCQATDRGYTNHAGEEENKMLSALPVPNLFGGLSAQPIERSTENRIHLEDVNRQYLATATFGPATRMWDGCYMVKTWRSPNLAYQPLYFEQPNLERYGIQRGVFQPVYSGVHFFTSVALLPYQTGVRRPHECEYGLGHYRPGDCAPAIRNRLEWSPRGLIRQGVVAGGLIAL